MREGELQEMKQMLTVHEERGIIQSKREDGLHLLRLKFGDVPEGVVKKIGAMESKAELLTLLERVLTADSLKEMGLEER